MRPGARAALYVPVVVGTLLILIPYCLLRAHGSLSLAPLPGVALGSALILSGFSASLWTIWDFAVSGRGTPIPLDPPRQLVTRGLYRYVRNPMAAGFVTTLLGQAVMFHSVALLAYALGCFGAIHLMVVLYEEPANHRRFGVTFETYCRAVPRWIPRLRDRDSVARRESTV